MNRTDLLHTVNKVSARGKFKPSWESLAQFRVPQWYQDGKFGIFIHWGPYCVPAFRNEWYPRNMYLQGAPEFEYHVRKYGPHDQFGYKDFVPLFKAENFDATAWARLFKEAGAKYIVPVAEHHDGFAMYNTALSRWNAAQMGPKRDVIGELAQATRREGLVFGLSSHRAEHWWFMNGGRLFDSDVRDPQYGDFYGPAAPGPSHDDRDGWRSKDWYPRPDALFLDDWLCRCVELVDRYQPQVFWFDWWIEQAIYSPYLQKFAAYYYNRAHERGLGAAINYKNEAFPLGAAVYDVERGKLPGINPLFWQTDTSVSYKSWCYIEDDEFKPAGGLVHDLVDIVSKNGCLLLNVGPRPDGTLPAEVADCLGEIGRWLEVNGEAIYGTRPWETYGEGDTPIPAGFHEKEQAAYTAQDIRFTRKGNALYAICLGWPQDEWLIKSLHAASLVQAEMIATISLLGSPASIGWRQDSAGLHLKPPVERPCQHAYTLKITLRKS
jgi:alpha-L-fucosidase